jgi:hypothetical protein
MELHNKNVTRHSRKEKKMSYTNKKTVTRDELLKMLDAMKIDRIEVEECYSGSLEVFVYAKDEEEVKNDQ